jgi:hypothetical protein
MAGFDVKQTDRNDLGVMGGGLLVLLSSFMPWYGASGGYISVSVSGWSAGFTAWCPILLSIALGVLVLLRVMKVYELPQLPVGLAVLSLGAAGLALLLVIIRWASLPSGGALGFNYGPRFGIFLGIIGIAAQAVFAFLAFKQSGEKIAWEPSSAPAAEAPATETPQTPAPPAPPAQAMPPAKAMPPAEEPQDPVAG